MTKKQLIQTLNAVKSQLEDAIVQASEHAKRYSDDPQSQANFEVGFLGGRIKSTLNIVNELPVKSKS